MNYLFFTGLLFIAIGLSLIIYVIFYAIRIKRNINKEKNADQSYNLNFQKLLPINLAGLLISFLGILVLSVVFILS